MANYPLFSAKKGSNRFIAQSTFYSDEYAEDMCDLHLRTEFMRDSNGKYIHGYRLHAKHPHTIEDALKYDIYCPKCKTHTLKQLGRCRNSHELGWYVCPCCDKH